MSNKPYTLLPEWSAQDAVMLTWPHTQSDWVDILHEVEAIYVALCHAITRFEKVLIVTQDATHQSHVSQVLNQANVAASKIIFTQAKSNDTWARDHGPLTVSDGETLRLLDFQFTGWGGKFAADYDNQINQALASQNCFTCDCETQDFILEGGGIETDGAGTLLTTSHCLLNPNRNSAYDRAQIETLLKTKLGMQQVIFLEHGYLAGDDTDSHIDTLARFVDKNTIVYQQCDDPNDEHFAELNNMFEELRELRNIHDKPYKLIALPWPAAKYDPDDAHRLPATYANFLMINQAVLLPVYQDNNDSRAIEIMQQACPDHEIIAIDCSCIIRQHGSLHCLTMQLPNGVLQD